MLQRSWSAVRCGHTWQHFHRVNWPASQKNLPCGRQDTSFHSTWQHWRSCRSIGSLREAAEICLRFIQQQTVGSMFKQAKYNSGHYWWKRRDNSMMMWRKTNESTNMSASWVIVIFRAIEESLYERGQCWGVDSLNITHVHMSYILITLAVCHFRSKYNTNGTGTDF